eukprot:109724_1
MAEQKQLLDDAIALTKTIKTDDTESPNQFQPSIIATNIQSDESKYSSEILRRLSKTKKGNMKKGDSITLHSFTDINNSGWKTPGDRDLRKIILYDGTEEKLYFIPDKYHHKKLFVSFTIEHVDVDDLNEQFRVKFYLQFNWIPSEQDYRSLYRASMESRQLNKPSILTEWTPEWYPHLEFENVIQQHSHKWRPNPKAPQKGPFRCVQYNKWSYNRNDDIDAMYKEYDFEKIKWFCAELECDFTFREELEIQSYPFDVQDLSVCMRIKEKDNMNYTVFGLPNYFNADATTVIDAKFDKCYRRPSLVGRMDPSFSQLDQWDVENCLIEFEFSKIVLSLKLARRWRPVVINTLMIIFLMSILSFTVFAVDFEDAASRLELTMTLILTAVLFDTKSSPKPYLTYLDKYILTSYGYLTFVMIENAICGFFDEDFDRVMLGIVVMLFLLQHVVFITYAIIVRQRENRKIFMGYEAVKKYNKRFEIERPKFFLYGENIKESGGYNKYKKRLTISGAEWN